MVTGWFDLGLSSI